MDLPESTTMRNDCAGNGGGGLPPARLRILMNWIGAEP